MDQIKHSYINVNGLNPHVAEIGSDSSPAALFLHGFPEIWYTWRHQMIAVADTGFRAIAPDYRGYRLPDVPTEPEKASFADLVNDTASILDSLAISKRIMDQIKHTYLHINGSNLHVAEIGSDSSPAVVFLHGFPEIWYTWRHQMIAVANAGFRAIAPDYRGYGLSETPPQPEKTRFVDLVNDTASILDSLAISKAFVIGKDFGAMVAYTFALFHPEKVAGIITLGVPFRPPGSPKSHQTLPEGFYIKRWQEPGRTEADFGRFDAKTVVRNVYIMFSKSEIPIASENQEVMDLVDPSDTLPSWFTEEDLSVYGELYNKSGFQTPLQVPYRSFKENIEPPKQGQNELKVEAPSLFIMGEKDYVFKFPGMEEYLKSGEVKKYMANLEIVYLPEGSHFVHEQFPDQVNELILGFLNRNKY